MVIINNDLSVVAMTAVKASVSPSGIVSGFLVQFGDPQNHDVTSKKDFFTAETDYMISDGTKSAVYYNHGIDKTLGHTVLSHGELSIKSKDGGVGVWIEAQLDLSDQYQRAIAALVKHGKLGWSSGTASHLVARKSHENGTHEITRWPLGLDASLTPIPADPRNMASIKSLVDLPTLDLVVEDDSLKSLTQVIEMLERPDIWQSVKSSINTSQYRWRIERIMDMAASLQAELAPVDVNIDLDSTLERLDRIRESTRGTQ